jgi:hypothetical protein
VTLQWKTCSEWSKKRWYTKPTTAKALPDEVCRGHEFKVYWTLRTSRDVC